MKKLWYLPLEPYAERYTALMSCPDGWAEDNFKRLGVPFERIDGEGGCGSIKNGVVLDAVGRCRYATSQIAKLLARFDEVQDGDVVYVEDFFHPSVESLFYVRHLTGKDFKVGCFIHAQSVDDTDFAYAMRSWMRPLEQSYGKQYDFIFTCSPILRKLCVDAGVGNESNVIYVGLPYNSRRLLEQLGERGFQFPVKKDRYVIFSSRFDDEKDPMFFLDLVEACPDIEFRLVNPRKDRPITSNKEVLSRLEAVTARCKNLSIVPTYDKLAYYETLAKAAVQFNCAHQDWVSWTLLEAVTFGCLPLYPKWKDFPSELREDERFLYAKRDLEDCQRKLRNLLTTDEETRIAETASLKSSIVAWHDKSWERYLGYMGLLHSC